MTTHTLSLGPLSLLATQTGPLLTITIHTPSDTAPVGRMTLTVAEWTSLVALVDCIGAADGRIADLTKERDALIASMYSAPFDRSLVVEVCHDLINRAMRNESDEIPDWRSSKHDRDKEAAIRALIADRDSLRQQVRELTEENERLRKPRREATDSDCPCWTSAHCRYHDSNSPWHAPCCPIQVHNDQHERDRLRSDLSAALVSVDAMAKRLEQLQPIVSVLGDWDWEAIAECGWHPTEDGPALTAACRALAHTAREQAKEKK